MGSGRLAVAEEPLHLGERQVGRRGVADPAEEDNAQHVAAPLLVEPDELERVADGLLREIGRELEPGEQVCLLYTSPSPRDS